MHIGFWLFARDYATRPIKHAPRPAPEKPGFMFWLGRAGDPDVVR